MRRRASVAHAMHHPMLARVVLAFVLSLPVVSFAQRRPQEFQAPAEMTEAQRAEAMARARHNIGTYKKDIPADVKPFPWMAAGMAVMAFAVAGIFAVPYYRNLTRQARNSGGANGP